MFTMTFFTQLFQFCHIDLDMGHEIVWWDGRAVEQGELHALGVLDTVVKGLAPHRTHRLFLGRGLPEVEIVEIDDTVRVHYRQYLPPREGNRLQASCLDDMDHHRTSETVLCRHDARMRRSSSVENDQRVDPTSPHKEVRGRGGVPELERFKSHTLKTKAVISCYRPIT